MSELLDIIEPESEGQRWVFVFAFDAIDDYMHGRPMDRLTRAVVADGVAGAELHNAIIVAQDDDGMQWAWHEGAWRGLEG